MHAYKVYLAKDAWEGLDIIDENYIDIFAIVSNDHIEKSTWDFLNELHKEREKITPIIFVSEKPSEDLNANIYKYGWYFIPHPIDHTDFMTLTKRVMKVANGLDDKVIELKKNRHYYTYKVKNITRIQRTRAKHIKVFSRDDVTHAEEEEEFFYEFPLHRFIEDHDIEKYMKQAQQSWLVNASEVKIVNPTDMELVLRNKAVVPTSKNYIDNFYKEEAKKE